MEKIILASKCFKVSLAEFCTSACHGVCIHYCTVPDKCAYVRGVFIIIVILSLFEIKSTADFPIQYCLCT